MRSLTETRGSARIAACGVLTALALIFSYIEFLVPLPIAIPGIKLGLANIVCLVCLYALGEKHAFLINVTRIALAALLFGSVFSALYALAGGVVSFAVMALLKRTKRFSVCGVSMAGGVFHNLAQLAVAGLLVESAQVFYYFPVLLLSGMATGIGIGILATLILRSIARDTLL
ncbi:MAG: Gx transporter family protein [Firmicutes bacterium]|nr:Gx transporter family protein [Bacillota bacterium]MCR4724851.1 Gx transporter family protein [Clostridia bacterium]MBQ4409231.1 Gx transporter family protein [Bacillota bacterium]MBQ6295456.1 Gx transporter family protein [Bacillota bacterium]MBR0051961.1 Gx transporter family protein [Bacillota bacterium]